MFFTKTKLVFLFLIIFLVGIFGQEIVIFFTGDTHGKIQPEEKTHNLYSRGPEKQGGAAYLGGLLKKLQKQYKNVITVDSGDIFDGAYINDKFEGLPQIEIMNNLKYDLLCPGNHDFRFSLDRLIEYGENSNFDIIGTNIVYKNNFQPVFTPWKIIEKDGIKIGFLSFLLDASVYKLTAPEIRIVEPEQIAAHWISELKKNGADIIVFLNHLGLSEDRKLAEKFSPDIIIGGHSHSVLKKEERINNTVIVHAGSYYSHLGQLNLKFNENKKLKIDYVLHEITSEKIEKDNEIDEIINKFYKQVNEKLGEKLGDLPVNLSRKGNKQTSSLYKFIVKAVMEETEADIADINMAGMRADLKKGNVTLKDIYNILPFDNEAVYAKIYGRDFIRDRYLFSSSPVIEDKLYTVVTNSYVASLSPAFRNSREKWVDSRSFRDIVADYIRNNY